MTTTIRVSPPNAASARTGEAALLRYVYCSRAVQGADAQRVNLSALARIAQARNASVGITGALVAANGYYLQVVEGPVAAVQDLIGRLKADDRHTDLVELDRSIVVRRVFGDTPFAWVERAEREVDTRDRMDRLLNILRRDPDVRVEDYFRLMLAPQVKATAATARTRPARRDHQTPRAPVMRVLIAGPHALWGPATLQHVASAVGSRVGRCVVQMVGADQSLHLVEYVDTSLESGQPLRLLGLADISATQDVGAQLLGPIDLVVLMASASDLTECTQQALPVLRGTARLPRPPAVLLLSSAPIERTEAAAATLAAGSGLTVHADQERLSDAPAVWALVLDYIQATAQESAAVAVGGGRDAVNSVSAYTGSVERLLAVDGCLGAALLCLASMSLLHGASPSQAATIKTPDLRQELPWLARLQALCTSQHNELLEDVIVQTAQTIEVYRPLPSHPHWVLALHVARGHTPLAGVRLALAAEAIALDQALQATQ